MFHVPSCKKCLVCFLDNSRDKMPSLSQLKDAGWRKYLILLWFILHKQFYVLIDCVSPQLITVTSVRMFSPRERARWSMCATCARTHLEWQKQQLSDEVGAQLLSGLRQAAAGAGLWRRRAARGAGLSWFLSAACSVTFGREKAQ